MDAVIEGAGDLLRRAYKNAVAVNLRHIKRDRRRAGGMMGAVIEGAGGVVDAAIGAGADDLHVRGDQSGGGCLLCRAYKNTVAAYITATVFLWGIIRKKNRYEVCAHYQANNGIMARCWRCFPKTTRARVRGVNGVGAWGGEICFFKI